MPFQGTFSKMSKNKSLQSPWSLSRTDIPRWQPPSFPHQLVWTWWPGFVLQIRLKPAFAVQLLSCVRLFANPWTAALQASLSFTISWSLLKLKSIKSVMPSSHLILCRPLLLLPSIFHSIKVFSNESALCIRWPQYWSFSFSISPSNEYSGLISFRIDWLDLPAVQRTLKSLLQHHSSKAPVLQHLISHMLGQMKGSAKAQRFQLNEVLTIMLTFLVWLSTSVFQVLRVTGRKAFNNVNH